MSRVTSSRAVQAEPIPAVIKIDRLTYPHHLLTYAHFRGVLDGRHPYTNQVRIQAPCAALELVPVGARVTRCATDGSLVSLLAELSDAVLLIEAFAALTEVTIASATPQRGEELVVWVKSRIPEPCDETVGVRVWHYQRGSGAQRSDRRLVVPAWDDIDANYPLRTRMALGDLVRFRPSASVGKLILWHGPPGTGKTTALRALIRSWAGWCDAQYIADPELFFAESGYMTEVLTSPTHEVLGPKPDRPASVGTRWRLVIAEDADEFLRPSARRESGAALGRLLNLADGILGQGMKALVLLTTNEEITRMHPALTRPGRCLAAVEFPTFAPHEAADWLGESATKSMTLAEMLERRGDLSRIGDPKTSATVGQYL